MHIDATLLHGPQPSFPTSSLSTASWKAARPRDPALVEPWFELSPRRPSIDTRVSATTGGVAAILESYGGITGPGLAARGRDTDLEEIVLGGNPVPPGTPAPDHPHAYQRQCTIRIAVAAESLRRGQQCLLVASVRALDEFERSVVQTLVGRTLVSEDVVVGDDRLALLLDAPADGAFGCEIWLRLAGTGRDARLGFRGVQAFLL